MSYLNIEVYAFALKTDINKQLLVRFQDIFSDKYAT